MFQNLTWTQVPQISMRKGVSFFDEERFFFFHTRSFKWRKDICDWFTSKGKMHWTTYITLTIPCLLARKIADFVLTKDKRDHKPESMKMRPTQTHMCILWREKWRMYSENTDANSLSIKRYLLLRIHIFVKIWLVGRPASVLKMITEWSK
jgi:hypothetical protein